MVVLQAFSPPTEGVRHEESNTQANIGGKEMGNGVLYIAEQSVSWVDQSGQGFCLQYPDISLHAVSRDLTAFPKECLYLMVDKNLEIDAGSDSGEEEQDSTGKITEIRFIPQETNSLDTLFNVMSDCQTLHPDPEDSFSEEEDEGEGEGFGEGDGEFFTSAGDAENLTPEGQARLQHLDNLLSAGAGADNMDDEDNEPQVGRAQAGGDNNQDEPMETGQFDDAPDH